MTEQHRIDFLVQRDGAEAARRWVARTLAIYREALSNPRHHASAPEYRGAFQQAIREFEGFLARAPR